MQGKGAQTRVNPDDDAAHRGVLGKAS